MRKFTWLGFEIRPLSIQDILWLIIFAAIIVLSKFYPDIKVRVGFEVSICGFVILSLMFTPLRLRFRGVFFLWCGFYYSWAY
jgi:uncharacterized membrane protein YcaP (DUF421 family)